MSRSTRKGESVSEVTPVGVAAEKMEDIVAKAVIAATAVIRDEFDKVIADLRERIERTEQRLSAIEQAGKIAEVLSADQVRTNETISRIHKESRQYALTANEAAPYLRRNNLRIRGLTVTQNEDCRKVVTEFIRKNLHVHIGEDDIESAYTISARSRAEQATSSPSSRQVPPVVMVRFLRRDVRDNVIRNRRLLKSTKYSIVEDLTKLNIKVFNRLRNSDLVQKT